jgi:C1A family cysteine protease
VKELLGGQMRHVWGWKRDAKDKRDLMFRARRHMELPKAADISQWCSVMNDQTEGSCTCQSSTDAQELLAIKNGKKTMQLSRLWLYVKVRELEGTPISEDTGAQLRDVMRVLAVQGCPPESAWPYEPHKWMMRPPAEIDHVAALHRITAYRRCENLDAIKQALHEEFPVVGGFDVPPSITSLETETSGIIAPFEPGERGIGGHAVLFVGYDDARQLLKLKNSWSEQWGDHGYGYLPYDYVLHGRADDFWQISDEQYYSRLLRVTDIDPGASDLA